MCNGHPDTSIIIIIIIITVLYYGRPQYITFRRKWKKIVNTVAKVNYIAGYYSWNSRVPLCGGDSIFHTKIMN